MKCSNSDLLLGVQTHLHLQPYKDQRLAVVQKLPGRPAPIVARTLELLDRLLQLLTTTSSPPSFWV
jgi:hypothetical protein